MSVNKVILVGRLGRDPETRYMPSGDAVTNFPLATDEKWRDKSGQQQTKTEWHNITMYGKLGEIASQYLRKGNQVFIEGRIQSRKYTGKDNVERLAYDIIGNEMKMLGSRDDGAGSDRNSYGSHGAAPVASVPTSSPATTQRQPHQYQQSPPVSDDIDDDIPF